MTVRGVIGVNDVNLLLTTKSLNENAYVPTTQLRGSGVGGWLGHFHYGL